MIARSILLAALIAALAAGCTSKEGGPSPEPPAPPETTTETAPATETVTTVPGPEPVAFTLPVSAVPFGEYAAVPLLGPDAGPYAGPPTPASLDGVQVAPEVGRALDRAGVAGALAERRLVLLPAHFLL